MQKALVHHDIKELIRSRIEGGEFGVGERVPSENQLVEQLGVGRSRVRQALRELEIEGYLVRKRGSGSYVAPGAGRISAVRVATPGTVAMVLPLRDSGYARDIVQGFMESTGTEGIQTIVYNVQRDAVSEAQALRNVVGSGVAALAVWIQHDATAVRGLVEDLLERRFPVVLVDRYIEDLETDCVASANDVVGYRLARALMEKGHTRIGFAGYRESTSSVRERLSGYRRALLERAGEAGEPGGPDSRLTLFESDLEIQPAEAVKGVMALRDRPTGFVCINDGVAALVHDELVKLGFGCPNDVELAAVNDHNTPNPLSFPMLSVTQRGREIGVLTAQALLARMAQPDLPPQRHFVDPSSVQASGTSDLPGSGKEGG